MDEFEFIKKIKPNFLFNKHIIKKSISDDCAVLNFSDEYDMLVTTDMLSENIHFKLDWYSPKTFVQKILYSNISDIYACGGIPFGMTIAAGLSKKINPLFLNSMIKNLKIECKNFNCDLFGGDTVSSRDITFSVTMFGIVKKDKAILRAGAKKNDNVYITGFPGLSGAGLYILMNKIRPNKNFQKYLVKKHLVPSIVRDKNLLKKIFDSANCMIDISDGLSSELNHISIESGKKIIIEKKMIPIEKNLFIFCKEYNQDIFKNIFSNGEDYHLLFTSDKDIKDKNIFKIGKVVDGAGVYLKDENSILKLESTGYKHKF